MASCCGQQFATSRLSGKFEDLALNERSMILVEGDDPACVAYHGEYTGTHFHVAGHGTEHERIFLRQNRRDAINYANEHGVKVSQLINARSFCHDRVVALLGS